METIYFYYGKYPVMVCLLAWYYWIISDGKSRHIIYKCLYVYVCVCIYSKYPKILNTLFHIFCLPKFAFYAVVSWNT